MLTKNILAEALSAILGVTVKLQSESLDSDGVVLDVTNLPTIALLGNKVLELLFPVSYLASLLAATLKLLPFFSDQSQTSQETQKQESATTSLRKQIFVIPDELFDPGYDFDFTHMSESKSDSECTRGNERYKRPYGWMRFALKVRDKFPDGNAWLGKGGWRNHSVSGEWPVSYHGTSLEGAEGIIKDHYKAGDRQAYGRGIYSSPDINVAEGYVKTFKSEINGKTYKVIMQNRVHPQKRKIIEGKNFWLVPIPAGTSAVKEKEIVESSIRPYGLLLKEV